MGRRRERWPAGLMIGCVHCNPAPVTGRRARYTRHMHRSDSVAALGGRSAAAFLRSHWHKRAVLIRGVRPGFRGWFSQQDLIRLACRDDVEARLVVRVGRRWSLAHGPFRRIDFRGLPARGWTLLVQGVNLVDAAGDALLREFGFLPYARLDDLMVSYAAPGGGVGPHCDSYDVFLLQGFGRRRWRYGRQRDFTLKPGLPLKILARFSPTHDVVLDPGDMLYLPPSMAHDGVAVDHCTTYSIGFRAASFTELAQAFLDHLRDDIEIPGRYADPDLRPTPHPALIEPRMERRIAAKLARLRVHPASVRRFLGCFLTEPKPHVRFERNRAIPAARFAQLIAARGLRLDRRAQLLYDAKAFYLNGEHFPHPRHGARSMARLADERRLTARECAQLPAEAIRLLHNAYGHGFLELDA